MKVKIKILDISYNGKGVGKEEGGKTIFVPKVDVGEEAEVEVLKTNKTFDEGKVLTLLNTSSHRIKPKCPYFEKCGGCDFQHLTYEREKEIKIKIIKREFEKIGVKENIEFVDSEKRFNYRNKITLKHQNGKLGFNEASSHNFVEISFCPLADERINNSIGDVLEFLKTKHFSFLKSVSFLLSESDVLITFLFTQREKLVLNEVLKAYSVFFAVGEVLEKARITKVFGKECFYKVCGVSFPLFPTSFLQVNTLVSEKLYQFVQHNVRDSRVVNAYSGQGVLSVILAEKNEFVFGIEYQKSSHEIAEKIKTKNMINFCGKVENVLPKLTDKVDAIVLDPARAGCKKEVLEAISKSNIAKIVYISCNFATLIRDLSFLLKDFEIENATIFDMFPLTANLETCVILTKK